MKKHLFQSGFAAIEAVLVLVIISLIGFVTIYVYHNNSQATKTYDKASETSATPIIKSDKAPLPSSGSSTNVDDVMRTADPDNDQSTRDISDADSSLNLSEQQ